jgi:hypothetical protein
VATITKADIAATVENFTVNIEDRLVSGHINKAWEIDFENIMPTSLKVAISGLSLTASGNTQLKALFNNHVTKCWAYRAYGRFLANHGNNVTPFGIMQVLDQDQRVADSKDRAFMIANNDRDASVFFSRFIKAMEDANWTFDGTVYLFEDGQPRKKPSRKFGIRAIN